MKSVLLIVRKNDDTFHIESSLTVPQRNRLAEICTGDEKILAEFYVPKLEVHFHCPNGSIIVLHN
jgi:hypothetical protein